MQCVDCHFETDVHGNGLLYGESRAATTIECIDCHGTIERRPTLITTGNSGDVRGRQGRSRGSGKGLDPPGVPRFFWVGQELFQRSMMSPDVVWEIPQTMDTIDPKSSHYNAKSAYAKTLRRDGVTWGDVPPDPGSSTAQTGARQLQHLLPDLPHLVGDQLLRLPPADEGEPARQAEQI